MVRDAVGRFWSHTDRSSGETGCWVWTGYVNKRGYGRVYWTGKRPNMAHRVAYQIAYGEIPQGKFICHHCDNPGCVNPAHLFLGTHRDNTLDALAKGRYKANRCPARGELNHNVKVSKATVLNIRELFAKGVSVMEISKKAGVSYSNIWSIAHRKSWRHI